MRQALKLESRDHIIFFKEGGAFDLHCFKLLKALHLSIPADRDSEKRLTRNYRIFCAKAFPSILNMNFEEKS